MPYLILSGQRTAKGRWRTEGQHDDRCRSEENLSGLRLQLVAGDSDDDVFNLVGGRSCTETGDSGIQWCDCGPSVVILGWRDDLSLGRSFRKEFVIGSHCNRTNSCSLGGGIIRVHRQLKSHKRHGAVRVHVQKTARSLTACKECEDDQCECGAAHKSGLSGREEIQ